jgi:HEPN domain-containing protein
LLEIVRPKVTFDIDVLLVETLDKLYIDARYPGELGLLPNGKPTREDAQHFFRFARSLYEQIKRTLEASH